MQNLVRFWMWIVMMQQYQNFDIIHMGEILEHIFDYHFVLNEENKVLKNGGFLIISVPNI